MEETVIDGLNITGVDDSEISDNSSSSIRTYLTNNRYTTISNDESKTTLSGDGLFNAMNTSIMKNVSLYDENATVWFLHYPHLRHR